MLVITSILAGGVYPWVIQQFQVRPSEQTLEKEFIERNIGMTRAAYGLDQVQVDRYNATTNAATGALAPDAADHCQHPAAGPEPDLGCLLAA